jgi:hypothetical protein
MNDVSEHFSEWCGRFLGESLSLPIGATAPFGPDFFRGPAHPLLTPGGLALPGFLDGLSEYRAFGIASTGPQTRYFVLTRVESGRSHYFRLPYSGVYVGEGARSEVLAFLQGYVRFEARFGPTLRKSKLVYSTGSVDVEVQPLGRGPVFLDGLPLESNGAQPAPAKLWTELERRLST